jgi:hypothetical protein
MLVPWSLAAAAKDADVEYMARRQIRRGVGAMQGRGCKGVVGESRKESGTT